jgi:hypothetical protein
MVEAPTATSSKAAPIPIPSSTIVSIKAVSKRQAATAIITTVNPIPLSKRIPENTEPLLLTISALIDLVDLQTSMLHKVAYVLDQDGMVLGLAYNQAYGD